MREVGSGPRDWQTARTQLARERLMLQLERGEKEKRLVPIDEVSVTLHAFCDAFKRRFMAIPPKIAARVAAESMPAKCQLIMQAEIIEMLTDLSEAKIVPIEPKADDAA
jgi:hypothetical protein